MKLPEWLDNLIFNELKVQYCPRNSDMTNIDDDKAKTLNYLGTYFPRSYAESYCIFSEYFKSNNSDFADKIKQLREDSGQLQRKVAAALDIDAGLYSKIERGERPAKREQVIALASILHTDEKELLTLWLADQIKEITESEKDIAEDAMEFVKMK